MIRKLLATTAVTALLAGGAIAVAQEQPAPAPAPAAPAAEPATPVAPVVQADGFLASNIIGETVYNGTGDNAENIGDVNDLVIDKAGGVYFTDPMFRAPTPLPQGKTCVYYVDAAGKVTRLIDDLPNPNGVLLSLDEKTLYVFPSGQKQMMSYPIESPGKIGKGKVFCELEQAKAGGNGGGDGGTIDVKGNVYITSATRVTALSELEFLAELGGGSHHPSPP